MKTKFLIFLLVFSMIFGLGGCSVNKETKAEPIKHLMAITDMKGAIKVIDLDAPNPASKDAIVWDWEPKTDKGWKLALDRTALAIDDAKLRHSDYYKKDVVLLTSSLDWVGIADYETGECLWESEVPYMPHSVEMLPGGDIVVAGSGGTNYMTEGCLMYYDISAGDNCKQQDLQLISSAHGVVYDPNEDIIWAAGWDHIVGYRAEKKKLKKLEDRGCRLLHTNGHDLSADYYDNDLMFVTTGSKVYQFSKSENKLLIEYNFADVLKDLGDVKGIASFDDGSVVYCTAAGILSTYDTDTFNFIRLDEEKKQGKLTSYKLDYTSFYKVRNFSVAYQ